MMRLLRPPRSGIFLRSFRLHSIDYARETIAKICSLWVALATAIISQTGSWQKRGRLSPESRPYQVSPINKRSELRREADEGRASQQIVAGKGVRRTRAAHVGRRYERRVLVEDVVDTRTDRDSLGDRVNRRHVDITDIRQLAVVEVIKALLLGAEQARVGVVVVRADLADEAPLHREDSLDR